jgi:hypothetical protein
VTRGGYASHLLDRWLPDPAVQTHHCCEASCDLDTLWAAANEVTIGESGLLGRLICWRIPGTRLPQSFHDRFTSHPFLVLEQGDHHLVAGLCGDIWAPTPALAHLSGPDEFRSWSRPRTARVIFANWATTTRRGAAIVSEVRVSPVDRTANLRLSGLRPLIGRCQGLIGDVPLRLAAERAELASPERIAA